MTIHIYDINKSAHLTQYKSNIEAYFEKKVAIHFTPQISQINFINQLFGLAQYIITTGRPNDRKLIFSSEYLYHYLVLLVPLLIWKRKEITFVFIRPPYLRRFFKRIAFKIFKTLSTNNSYILFLSKHQSCECFHNFPELADFEYCFSNKRNHSSSDTLVTGFGTIDSRKKINDYLALRLRGVDLRWIGGSVSNSEVFSFHNVNHHPDVSDDIFLRIWRKSDNIWCDQQHNYSSATVYRAALEGKNQIYKSDSTYLKYVSSKLNIAILQKIHDDNYVKVIFCEEHMKQIHTVSMENFSALIENTVN